MRLNATTVIAVIPRGSPCGPRPVMRCPSATFGRFTNVCCPRSRRSRSSTIAPLGFGDDPDVDAEAAPPQHLPVGARDTNPELVTAVKALFNYPYDDMRDDHMKWLAHRSAAAEKQGGYEYWSDILNK